ncbi:S8 family serine peptidase [Paraneptunicella aestuarii]|uniref:S8 family serine peptidase n=1 Tax=Paraneptunicella aestuarii TaxID=2831148 RepID=UPI001E62B7FC|nr:S8 family serine peptidase [Paraneptunicella aestuarii]UAA40451.1 S8 family serine peptidase [Paraneptunicella aestuarii]
MNTKFVKLSAISIAIMGSTLGAHAAELKAVATPANANETVVSAKDFSSWYAEQHREKYAAVTDQFIVRLNSDTALKQLQLMALGADSSSLASAKAGQSAKEIMRSLSDSAGLQLEFVKATKAGEALMKISSEKSLTEMNFIARALQGNQNVASAEADPRRYPMAQNSPWGLASVQANQLSDAGASNTTVCIIDSGYDGGHPDLPTATGTNDSGTGSWNVAGGSHGSHVAGTIAAMNNSYGVQGILPNSNVNLHIVKVFNESGWAYSSDLVNAVQKCQTAGADVVNMSLGGSGSSTSESNGLQAIYNANVLLIAAAGNDGDATHSYPASYDSVVSVAAVDETGLHAEFSQYTSQVELSGPGEAILSTVAGDGRQGFITYGATSLGDDRVLPQGRYTPSGTSYVSNNVNGTATGTLAVCSRSGSTYSCGDMTGKICIAERNANQAGSSYTEIDNGAEACANAGAEGVIIYSNSARPGLQNPFLVDANSVMTMPTVSVNRTTGQQLVAAAGTSATLQVQGNTDYAYYNGTSMATPHVTGVAALAWSVNPTCTAAEVRNALKQTALDLNAAGRDNYTGYGLVQAKAASDYMAANCGSGGGSGGGTGDGALTKGQAETGLTGTSKSSQYFTIDVPAGATDLTFNLSGGTGDADLYVSFGSQPSTSTYDCRSWASGNNESCSFATPSAGTYHVLVHAYSAFSGASLVADYTAASGGGSTGGSATETNLSAAKNAWLNYTLDIPTGMSTLDVSITGGTGDADLYVRYGTAPTTSTYDCRPYKSGNEETCSFTNPTSGTWHLGVRAYSAFSGVTLNATYQ